jgi:hypothetical protein
MLYPDHLCDNYVLRARFGLDSRLRGNDNTIYRLIDIFMPLLLGGLAREMFNHNRGHMPVKVIKKPSPQRAQSTQRIQIRNRDLVITNKHYLFI